MIDSSVMSWHKVSPRSPVLTIMKLFPCGSLWYDQDDWCSMWDEHPADGRDQRLPERDPEGDLFMAQPSGFEEKGHETLVCRLKKSLYGLKQSPRCWYEELSKHLVSTGFKQSRADPCVFYKWSNGNLTVICVYVDDLIKLADLVQEMLEVKEQLSRRFWMKDLGDLHYCLGIGVSQGDGWIQLQQRQYILNLLHRFELADAHPVGMPADTNVPLEADDDVSQPADQKLYQHMIGHCIHRVCPRAFLWQTQQQASERHETSVPVSEANTRLVAHQRTPTAILGDQLPVTCFCSVMVLCRGAASAKPRSPYRPLRLNTWPLAKLPKKLSG